MKDGVSHDGMMAFLVSTMKLKAKMLERGQTKVDVKCAKCSGTLHARLEGRKNHLRVACDGSCKRSFME
jgi:hypothetical protein